MPQQTKTEALEELARLIRRDIMDGTAPLNGVWWFTDDVRLQDRIAHVLLDYSDEEKPEEIDKVCYNSRLDVFCGQIDELTEKCAALVVERDAIGRELGESRRALAEEFKASQRAKPEAGTLRIDTDMSDPQPGKLLVVRLDDDDVGRAWMLTSALHRERGEDAQPFWPSQFVGFLVGGDE